jgi:CRISPR-associated exonuclease Cas4
MEQNSDLVLEGKLIHEESYPQRSSRYEEIELDGIKVDYYDANNKVIHEIKKSNKIEKAHLWQVKYYIYVFERNGIDGVRGLLEYPLLRKTEEVVLTEDDRAEIERMMEDIRTIVNQDDCPPLCKKGFCRNCSYFEFCYSREEDIE